MSTNFYQRPKGQDVFDEEFNHIGLSTANLFIFEAHPSRAIRTFSDWVEQLKKPGFEIVSDYREVFTLEAFLEYVEPRNNADKVVGYTTAPKLCKTDSLTLSYKGRYRDESGHVFCNYHFS